jgi:hypothetical protein
MKIVSGVTAKMSRIPIVLKTIEINNKIMETKNITRPTFEQTVDVLVKAYLNDTLVHGNCCACVVGNLCAHAIGTRVIKIDHDILHPLMRFRWAKGEPVWHNVFVTPPLGLVNEDSNQGITEFTNSK